MTNLQNDHDATICADRPESKIISYEARTTTLGPKLELRRALPLRFRRTIGPWCFLDHFGPVRFEDRRDAMFVGPHPHIGLQTVTWLLDGEVLHRDSLGSAQRIRPGQLNVMTSGRAISHSEETPTDHDGHMHGVQLWIALPDDQRSMEPSFEHHPVLPMVDYDAALVTVLAGTFLEKTSPATYHSPIVGLDIHFDRSGTIEIPLDPGFEHGLVVLLGEATVEDEYAVDRGTLLYVGPDRDTLSIEATEGTIVLLVGGAPFGEEIIMWWNFVGRTGDEIREARDAWQQGERFGDVEGFEGPRIDAPPLRGLPKARG